VRWYTPDVTRGRSPTRWAWANTCRLGASGMDVHSTPACVQSWGQRVAHVRSDMGHSVDDAGGNEEGRLAFSPEQGRRAAGWSRAGALPAPSSRGVALLVWAAAPRPPHGTLWPAPVRDRYSERMAPDRQA